MNESDKIEIGNLLKGMSDMANYAKQTNGAYLDEKIVKYAKEAKDDYIGNKEIIKNILKDNLGMFLNLNALEISNTWNDAYKVQTSEKINICIGNNLHIVIRITDFIIVGNNGYRHTFNVKDFEIYDIFFRTSDTDDKNYSICCWENLVDRCEANFVIDKPTNVKRWECIYNRAVRTRQMNELLVAKFKDLMKKRIDYYKGVADSNVKIKEEISNISMYVKVMV